MKELRIWIVIGCILMIGTGVTLYTRFYVGSRGAAMETTAAMAKEAGAAMATQAPEDIQAQMDGSGEGSAVFADSGISREETQAGPAAASGIGSGAPESAPGVRKEASGAQAERVMEDRALPAAEAGTEMEMEANRQTKAPGTAVISEAGPLSQEAEPAQEAPISPLTGGRIREEKTYLVADYRKRLEDLDTQIQKMREEETGSNVYSIKTSASTELRMWESEMNAVYNALMEMLPAEEAAGLAADQQEWLKNRDAKAAEHSGRGSGGSIEGIGYASTLASLTRDRAYELVDQYEEANGYTVIEEPETGEPQEQIRENQW